MLHRKKQKCKPTWKPDHHFVLRFANPGYLVPLIGSRLYFDHAPFPEKVHVSFLDRLTLLCSSIDSFPILLSIFDVSFEDPLLGVQQGSIPQLLLGSLVDILTTLRVIAIAVVIINVLLTNISSVFIAGAVLLNTKALTLLNFNYPVEFLLVAYRLTAVYFVIGNSLDVDADVAFVVLDVTRGFSPAHASIPILVPFRVLALFEIGLLFSEASIFFRRNCCVALAITGAIIRLSLLFALLPTRRAYI